MFHYPLRSPRMIHLLLQLKLKNPFGSLSGSSASTNRFRISYKSPLKSTSSAIINSGCHINSRWATKFGCTYRKSTIQDPIGIFAHSIMGRTPSPRMWVIIISISTFLLSLDFTQCSTWISFDHISDHYWKPQR
jgi:hypothetical protein